MKIGIVGYAKPDMESLIQAYALEQYLKEYKANCCYTEDYSKIKDQNQEVKISKSFSDRLIHRQYMEAPLGKAAKIQGQFVEDILGVQDPKAVADAYIMINQKAMIDMHGKKAKFVEFYQRTFEKSGDLKDALLLCTREEYEAFAKPSTVSEDYILLDCDSEKSPLIPFAQKCAQQRGCKVVSIIKERKYNDFEQTVECYDPREYLGLVKGAKMVIAETFMSAFFGIVFDKEIVAGDVASLPGKNRRLLTKLNISDHYFDKKELPAGANYEIKNKERVTELLRRMYVKAENYLLNYIEPEKKERKVDCPTDILLSECCGCYACEQVCPVNAITMEKDSEGFYYPHADDKCIHCNLCAKVCVKKENHQTLKFEEQFPKAYCAINHDEEVRFKSSSGGVFPSLAKHVIEDLHGVVFGVKWDENLTAVSTMAETMEEVESFYGSKYVKSEIKDVYKKVKEQLAADRYVLYSGLPCECAGLKAYLRKDYEKLILCEILCHAAPSPEVFKDYIGYIEDKFGSKVKNVIFREKSKGWLIHKCSMVFEFADRKPLIVNSRRNNYFRNFLQDNISRPGCADCSFTSMNRVGDFTVGDFWGINRLDEELFDDKGASVVLVNTQKGAKYWSEISGDFNFKEKSLAEAFKHNHKKPMPLKPERDAIFARFREEPIDGLLLAFNDLKQDEDKKAK